VQVQLWDLRKAGSNTLTLGGSGAGQQQIITSMGVKQKVQELLDHQREEHSKAAASIASAKGSSSGAGGGGRRVFGTDISNSAGGRGGAGDGLPYFQEIKSHPLDPNLLAFITNDTKVRRSP
jgi:hypothetical protein